MDFFFITYILFKIYTNIKRKIYCKKFWIKVLLTFVIGFSLRLLILHFAGVNVLLNLLHPASIGYYLAMAITAVFSGEFINMVFPDKLFMDNNSGPSTSTSTSTTAGNSTLSPEDKARWDAREKILESSRKKVDKPSSNEIFSVWVDYLNNIIPKIEAVVEYNRFNHKSFKLGDPKLEEIGLVSLSEEELWNLRSLIEKDPNVSKSILAQVESRKGATKKAPNGTILKYLENIKKNEEGK